LVKAPDTTILIGRLRELHAQGRSEEMFAELTALLTQMSEQNTELQLRLLKALKQTFGRTSEKVSADQLSMFLATLGEAAAPAAPPADLTLPALPVEPKKKKGHGRRPLPDDLPKKTTKIPAPVADCPTCGKPMAVIGHDCKRVLEYVPARFEIQETLIEKRACGECAKGVVSASDAGPDKLRDGSLVGPGLLANVLLSKYKDSLPLNRLSGIYKRSGIEIPVSTLADWVAIGADALRPIWEEILRQAKDSLVLMTDDTGLKVLDRDSPHGIKKGHVWVYVGDGRWAAFLYTPDWKSGAVKELLKGRVGYLMHDGYAGYEGVHADNPRCIELGCVAHFRRGFVETLDAGDSRAAVAIAMLRQVYQVEELAKDKSPEERHALRQQYSKAFMDQLGTWMAETLKQEPPKSKLAKAINYGVNRWAALTRFLDDGCLPIDNNASERALRAIAVGRANYLFAGSDEGAKRAAIAYSLIGTCALCGVDPWEYLRDVLTKMAGKWPRSRIAELLPPNWAAARAATSSAHVATPTAA
jgi:transposase